jgi:glycosyltransferase involved in cell wall biosynthesis
MRSVLDQDYPDIEYIVVDPESTDGSRGIIEQYRRQLSKVILEPDKGAADGLNKGFEQATGEIFGFLNSDDVLLPGAVRRAVEFLEPGEFDIVSGQAVVIDAMDQKLRIAYSDRYSLKAHAYGASILIQPSTFFTSAIYRRTQGFNIENRSNWDGELFVDMAIAGARFGLVNEVWSGYRLHEQSITSSGKLHQQIEEHHRLMFSKILGRDESNIDRMIAKAYLMRKYLLNPRSLYERITKGPIYRRPA